MVYKFNSKGSHIELSEDNGYLYIFSEGAEPIQSVEHWIKKEEIDEMILALTDIKRKIMETDRKNNS
jgi:hypothetical protein